MKKKWGQFLKATLILIFLIPCLAQTQLLSPGLPKPPATPRIPVTDNYFGLKVTDHYRWMENLQDSSVMKWFEEQDAYAENIFDRITGRDELLAEYDALDSIQKEQVWNVRKDNDTYIFLKWNIRENRTRLVRRKGESRKDEVVIDFKEAFPGENIRVARFEYSTISQYVAFYIYEGLNDALTLFFYDLSKNMFLADTIRHVAGGYLEKTNFSHDGMGFFYTHFSMVNGKPSREARYHRLGTSPDNDKVLVSFEKYPGLYPGFESSVFPFVSVDRGFNYLLLYVGKSGSAYNFIANYRELENEKIDWKMLSRPDDKLDQPIIRNKAAYFLCKKDSPGNYIVKSNLQNLDHLSFETVVPSTGERERLDRLPATKNFLLLRYTDGITTWFKQYNIMTGETEVVPINLQGIAEPERISENSNEIRLTLQSWNKPPVPILYNAEEKKWNFSSIKDSFQLDGMNDLKVKEIEIPGHDGVKIPLSIIYDKNTKLDGKAICILDAYGAFGWVYSPVFIKEKLVLCKKGVVLAVAHVRGGGEKGEVWWSGGKKATKPNSWKDFISCAEYLVRNKYTSKERLIGEGTSAGGIVIGRAITERPDLFAVAVNRVGVTNILGNVPSVQTSEYGTISDSAECRYLFEMDALYHVKEKENYPAVLNTAGIKDGSCWQQGKFAAAMQYSNTSNKPVLLQVYFKGGHSGEFGANKNRNAANEMAFALWQAGHPDFKLKE